MQKKRLIGLDLLRFILAFIILMFHSAQNIQCNYGVLQPFVKMGAICMSAFFVVSGFCLFYVYDGQDLLSIENIKIFYKKRLFSILPLYYVIALWVTFIGKETFFENIILLPVSILGIQSTFSSLFNHSHYGGTWFISCILLCYLIYPFFQNLVKQMTIKQKILCVIGCGGVLLYAPIIVYNFSTTDIYSNPFYRILEFVIGIICASLYQEFRSEIEQRAFFGKRIFFLAWGALILGVSGLYGAEIFPGNYMMYSWITLPLFLIIILCSVNIELRRGGRKENNKLLR